MSSRIKIFLSLILTIKSLKSMKMISLSKEMAIIKMKRPLKESRDNVNLYKNLKTGYSMKDSGSEQRVMVSVNKNGPMERYMKDNGKITRPKEKENLYIPMAITTRVNGEMIKQMVMEYSYMLKLELDMKAIGKMICNMDQECRFTVTAINTKVCLSKEGEMEREPILIQLVKYTLEDGLMVVLRDMVFVFGQMGKNMMVNGKITKNMVLEYLPGLMEDRIKGIIEMIKNMVTGLIHGLMVVSI